MTRLWRARLLALICLAWTTAAAAQPAPVPLWPQGAPGSEGKTTPETVRLWENGERIVSSVHAPSITPYLPDADRATGAAVIVIPGGGHRELWMDHEGYRVGEWLRAHGVAAFVLKHRLAKEQGSTYTVRGESLADVRRAIRMVRSRAGEWGIRPDRIGVMGFSAGGELAALAGAGPDAGLDREDPTSARPDFMALIYPAIPDDLDPASAPPSFLLAGEDDGPAISQGVPTFYLALRRAGVSAELHILAHTGHGFGLRDEDPPAVRAWPELLLAWMGSEGLLDVR